MKEILVPMNGYVLVNPIKQATITESGLYLPENAQHQLQYGTVEKTSLSYVRDGMEIGDTNLRNTEKVLFSRYSAVEVDTKDGKHLLVKESDIFAVFR